MSAPSTRRRFLQTSAASVAAAGWFAGRSASAAESQIPTLSPRREMTLCPWTAANPRHDHQLLFPLNDGRLLFVWSEYYTDDAKLLARRSPADKGGFGDEMPCRISAMTSSDGGRTWSDPYVLEENRWKLNVKHPNLVRVGNGDLLFTFTGWDSMAQRNIFLRRSTDDGATWSDLTQISSPGWYCTNNDHVLRLSGGRVVLPAHGVLGGGPYSRASKLESFMYLTDDDGRTWRRSRDGLTAVGRGCHEPTVVELRDGRLLCFLRTTNACIYRSTSDDGGDHWTVPEPTDLIAPDSPPLLKRLSPTGDLLLVWNRVASKKGTPRTPLTAAISRDEGTTWENVRHIEPDPKTDAAYASVLIYDKSALVCYYHRPHSWTRDTEIRLRVYDVDDFYRPLG